MNNKLKQQVVDARLNRGFSYGKIKRVFGVAKSTAQGWVAKAQEEVDSQLELTGFYHENFQREKEKVGLLKGDSEGIQRFLEQLAPIHLDKPIKRKIGVSSTDYVVVAGDFHFPLQCDNTVDILLKVIEEVQPKAVILNGDTVDLLAVSKYPKDIRKSYTLLEEREAYHNFLDRLLSVTGEDTVIYETSANHSGNGVEGRWWRYISANLGDLSSLPELKDTLSYQNVFLGPYQDHVEYVDYVQLTDNFVVLHGDVVRKNGGYSARGMFDKWHMSLMHNHTHRFGMTAQRVPALGNRPNKQYYAWENGCMCDLDPVYASATNWQAGFSIIALDGDSFGVEPVMVNDGVATVASLGKTFIVK